MADRCGRLTALAVLMLAGSAGAQVFTWQAAVNGVWDDPAPWGGVDFPMDGADTAIIAIEGVDYVVDLNGFDVDIMDLQLTSSNATLSGMLSGGTVTINNQTTLTNSMLEQFAFESLGGLLFDSTVCDDLCDIVFSKVGGTITWQNVGVINLVGATTFTLDANASFVIDSAMPLMIDDPSVVTNNGSILKSSPGTTAFMRSGALGVFENPGTVEVTDGAWETDALDLTTDTLEEGTWIVRNGASLDLLGQTVLTNQASVTFDGIGSVFPAFADNMAVNDPTGVISIEGAGTEFETADDFTNNGLVAVDDGALFRVELVDGDFTNFVGGTITGGMLDLRGTFQFAGAAIDTIDSGVTLDGVGSAIVDELFNDAFLALDTITPGGMLAITNGKDLTIAEPTFMVEGALMVGPMFAGDLSMLTAAGDIVQPSGVTLLNDGVIMHGGTYVLSGTGQLRGNGMVTGPLVNAGRTAPGLSPGLLQVQPFLQIDPPGVVEIELGGFIPVVEYDQIQVFGELQFAGGAGGTLEVILIDGFTPSPGDTFDIILANAVLGQFAEVVTPNLPCELDVLVEYIDGKEQDIVQVVIVEDCIADCNDDGLIDILDFMCFQQMWQDQTPCGDCNGDGAYNILDFVCFQNEWRQGC